MVILETTQLLARGKQRLYPTDKKIFLRRMYKKNFPIITGRAVQNLFRRLTKSGLLVKCKKSDSICKANKTYEVTYRIPFIVSQQTMNSNFIKLHREIRLETVSVYNLTAYASYTVRNNPWPMIRYPL